MGHWPDTTSIMAVSGCASRFQGYCGHHISKNIVGWCPCVMFPRILWSGAHVSCFQGYCGLVPMRHISKNIVGQCPCVVFPRILWSGAHASWAMQAQLGSKSSLVPVTISGAGRFGLVPCNHTPRLPHAQPNYKYRKARWMFRTLVSRQMNRIQRL